MKKQFNNILKGIFLTSVASLLSTSEVEASPYNLDNLDDSHSEFTKANDSDTRLKHILKFRDDKSYIISGHRSHSSHRSHRSHSSHRSHRSSSYGSYSSGSSTSSSSSYSTGSSTSSSSYTTSPRKTTTTKSRTQAVQLSVDMKHLVEMLIKLGYITSRNVSKDTQGKYLYTTKIKKAVQHFQVDYNMTVDGIAGKATILKMEAAVKDLK